MREFADGFVAPLARALRFANSDLNLRGFVGDGMTPPIVTEWPDRAVPDDMYPPRNEHLVIDLDDVPHPLRDARQPQHHRRAHGRQGGRGPHRGDRRPVPRHRSHRPQAGAPDHDPHDVVS